MATSLKRRIEQVLKDMRERGKTSFDVIDIVEELERTCKVGSVLHADVINELNALEEEGKISDPEKIKQ